MPRTRKPRPQPHTFPEQERGPRKRRYLVTGPQRVGEVERGGYVELALTEAQERVLLDAGCVKLASEVRPEPEKESPHATWAEVKKNRPSKADTTEQE